MADGDAEPTPESDHGRVLPRTSDAGPGRVASHHGLVLLYRVPGGLGGLCQEAAGRISTAARFHMSSVLGAVSLMVAVVRCLTPGCGSVWYKPKHKTATEEI